MSEAARRLARPDAAERIATSSWSSRGDGLRRPRLHMVGIGGAGMSALAAIAYAWGAEVDGCDTAASEYTRRLERFGIRCGRGPRPRPPRGREWRWSSRRPCPPSRRGARGAGSRPRASSTAAELLAEMVAARRSICVGGAHGKTTTTAMIAYAATRLGFDPTWLVGGDVPQLGGNAGPGGGELLVAEADESDGLVRAPAPADRARHQRRARPSRPLRVGAGRSHALFADVGRERPGRRRGPLGRRR